MHRVAIALLLAAGVAVAQPPPSDTPPDPSVGERYDGQVVPDRRSDWRDGLLWVPRALLYPIRLLFRGLWYPVRQGLEYDERHQVSQRVVDAFTSDDGLMGLRLAFAYTTGFRPSAGFSFFDLRLLGPDTAFHAVITGSGADLFHGEIRLRPTANLDRHRFTVAAIYDRRPDRLYTGIGTTLPGPPGRLAASRYSGDWFDLTGNYGWAALRWLSLHLDGSFGYRRFGEGEPTGGDANINDIYCIRVVGRCTGVVDPALVPGFYNGTQFLRAGAHIRIDTRDSVLVPSSGVLFDVGADYSHGLGSDPSSYFRLEGQVGAVINLWQHSRVLVLRAAAGAVAPTGQAVTPFSELLTLGGPDDLRGFRIDQFRGYSSLLLTAEYRWPIWMWMDGTLFADWGGVFDRWWGNLSTKQMQPDIGIGIRMRSRAYFFRIQLAYGFGGGGVQFVIAGTSP